MKRQKKVSAKTLREFQPTMTREGGKGYSGSKEKTTFILKFCSTFQKDLITMETLILPPSCVLLNLINDDRKFFCLPFSFSKTKKSDRKKCILDILRKRYFGGEGKEKSKWAADPIIYHAAAGLRHTHTYTYKYIRKKVDGRKGFRETRKRGVWVGGGYGERLKERRQSIKSYIGRSYNI